MTDNVEQPLETSEPNTLPAQFVDTGYHDLPNQKLFNDKSIITVESVADFANLEKWEGRTVYVKDSCKNYRYNVEFGWSVDVLIEEFVSTQTLYIVSANINDDKAIELQQALDTYPNLLINTYIALNSSVNTGFLGQRIIGNATGKIVASNDMAKSIMINVMHDEVIISGVVMDNPLMLKSTTGGRQTAIGVQAHRVTIENCIFYRMLHSVSVTSSGEWLHTNILNNRALECIGVGSGDSSTSYGEDRGDAFICWGAGCIMTGNLAVSMLGQDCRIAFHCEGLGGSSSGDIKERTFIVANNIARGSFRRHFVFEDIYDGIFDSNISEGGATWWNLAIVQCTNCIISNMIIKHTTPALPTAGGTWNPTRGAIALMNWNSDIEFSNLQVVGSSDVSQCFIVAQTLTKISSNITFNNCVFRQEETDANYGLAYLHVATPLKFNNCFIKLNGRLASTFAVTDSYFYNCDIYDTSGFVTNSGAVGSTLTIKDCNLFNSTIVYANTALSCFIQACTITNPTESTTPHIYYWNLTELRLEGCKFIGKSGTISNRGSANLGADPSIFLSHNLNLSNEIIYSLDAVGLATSNLNKYYKFTGRIVKVVDGSLYVASGNNAAAPWVPIN